MVRRNDSFALHKDPASRSDIVREAGVRAPSGHPDRCLVGISLILLCRAWSKLDVQVVVCNWVGDPFKAWVAGSNPAALTKFCKHLPGLATDSVPLLFHSSPRNDLVTKLTADVGILLYVLSEGKSNG
jgi:hypothetical protein